MSIMNIKDPQKIRVSIVFFGIILGLSYQLFKVHVGVDGFWNIRLVLILILGILFVYATSYLSGTVIRIIAGRYDVKIQVEDMKTYLPLCMLPFLPLQA